MTPEREAVLDALNAGHHTAKDIANFLKEASLKPDERKQTSNLLAFMVRDGEVKKAGHGKFILPGHSQADVFNKWDMLEKVEALQTEITVLKKEMSDQKERIFRLESILLQHNDD